MFDAVRNNKRIVQFFLLLITLPFAFWGMESYIRNAGGPGDIATVDGAGISRQEFGEALRDQQERLRAARGRGFDQSVADSPELRQATLDSLVTRRVLLTQASRARLAVSDAELRELISAIPALQEDGKFSMQRYEQLLRGQNLTRAGFEQRVRQDLILRQMVNAVSDTAIVSQGAAERTVAIQLEQREVAEVVIRPEPFAAQVKLSGEAVKDFYDKNRKQFEDPVRIRAEFVVFSIDALAQLQTVKAEEVDRRFEEEIGGKLRQRDEARATAERILARLKSTPDAFAELAKQHSQDAGTAIKGGDLDFFSRGSMVKPFEDAAFRMKEGQISGIVESDFGFHIIRLTGIRRGAVGEERRASHILFAAPPAPAKSGTSRQDVEREMKREAALKQYAEIAEAFSNTVYEQPDSLGPAAERFRLTVQQTGFFGRMDRAAAGPLGNEKLLAALFSEDATKNKRNTEAVEVAPNVLVAARVLEHKPAALRPLESVRAEIEKDLVAEEAARLAQRDGEGKLARLRNGENISLNWSAAQMVPRQAMRGLVPEAQKAIFAAPSATLPAYAGVQTSAGAYMLLRISQVKPGVAAAADPRVKAQYAQLARLSGNEDFNAYLAALRVRYPVKVNKAVLEAKER